MVQANRLKEKIRKFFLDNPDEYLTVADLFVKFPEYHKQTVRNEIYRLRKEGFLGGAYMNFINPTWKKAQYEFKSD